MTGKRSDRVVSLKNRSGEKYLTAFILGSLCLILTLIPIIIAEKGFFIYSGDYNAQQITFYNLGNDTVRSGSIGWNWLTDLGSDFLTSYSFYLFGSPFFWLSVLLPRGLVTYSMPFLLALKHGLASLTAYCYIRRFVRNKDMALIGGLLYAFSGFQLFNIFFNHFQDVTAFFPLMLIAMEEFVNNRRRGVFALTVAFMAFMNYYFFAGQAVFLVMYYLFRSPAPDFRASWKKFFTVGLEAVLGVMAAAVILIPSALLVTGNYRVNEHLYGVDMVAYTDPTLIPRIIQSFFMPPDAPAAPNLFYSEFEQWASIGGYLPLFSMAGVAAFFRTNKKHWAVRLSICCMIFAAVPILNSAFQMFNAFYYARWFYMPILIFCMMTAHSLDNTGADLRFGLRFTAAMLAAFALIGAFPTHDLGHTHTFFFLMPKDIAYFWLTIGVAAACLIASAILIKRRAVGKSFAKPSVILTCVASIACTATMVYYCASSISGANSYIKSYIHGGSDVYENVSEDNFFRTDISEGMDNCTMIWGLPCVRAFQSVVTPSIMNFYNTLGIQRDVGSRADLSHYTLRGLLSVKYYYRELDDNMTYDEIKSSAELSSSKRSAAAKIGGAPDYTNADVTEMLSGFEYLCTNGSFEVYENKLYLPVGFAYNTYVTPKTAKSLGTQSTERLLLDSLILTDEQAKKYSDCMKEAPKDEYRSLGKNDYISFCRKKKMHCSKTFTYDEHGFTSEIDLSAPELVFFSVPYSKGWTAEVNGKPADVEEVSYGFMAVRGEKGNNVIKFHYETPGLKAGIAVSAAGILLLAAYIIICRMTQKNKKDYDFSHYYDYDGIK